MFVLYLLARLRRRSARRAAARQLFAMSDYELKDIGLTRGEINAAVDGLSRDLPEPGA
jgi:uncharacterized protein YjiS (DUF1127 family)